MEKKDIILEEMARELIENSKDIDRQIEVCNEMTKLYNEKINVLVNKKYEMTNELEEKIKTLISFSDTEETKTQQKYKLPSLTIILKNAYKAMKVKENIDLEKVDKKYVKITKKLDWATWKKDLTITKSGRIVDKEGVIIEDIEIEEKPEKLTFKLED